MSAAVVRAAIGESTASVSRMLQCLSETLGAFGAVLWEEAPGVNWDSEPPSGSLFVLAAWFPHNELFALHDLPLLASATGRVVISQNAALEENIQITGGAKKTHPFLVRHDITSMCSVPITFLDYHRGAINIYRRRIDGQFNKGDLVRLQHLASLIPSLYQAARDKANLGLVEKLELILHYSTVNANQRALSKDVKKEVLQRICQEVSRAFNTLETSVFLKDRTSGDSCCHLQATTWSRAMTKTAYRQDDNDGITGWVFRNAKPVKIFDLAQFHRDKSDILRRYPGLNWKDSLRIQSTAVQLLGLTNREELPPLTFMATPIRSGDIILGVMRCCTATRGPYYFSDRDLELFQFVAAQISRCWITWEDRWEIEDENQSWEELVRSISKLNQFVQEELAEEAPSERKIFAEALRLTNSIINGAEIIDVRLVDDVKQELYFAATHGDAWAAGSQETVKQRLDHRFSLKDEPSTSEGAAVIKTGKLSIINDISESNYYANKFFPNVKRMIIAPLKVKQKVFGVLDIQATGSNQFPKYAGIVAELLGRQLGLYHDLAIHIGQLRRAETELKDNLKKVEGLQADQNRMFEDLAHQIKGPITQAQRRAEVAVYEMSTASDRMQLQAIRGICRKARRVAMSIGLLAELARDRTIRIAGAPMDPGRLVKLLIESAQDNELTIDPNRGIKFSVDRESFVDRGFNHIKVDYDLLEQAINNVFDNAAKYSFSNTVVRIEASVVMAPARRFQITVVNTGLRLHPNEVNECIKRNWRSPEARHVTGEGSGIGLWIVDQIMRAHRGRLIIVPTNADDRTEVKFIF